MKKNVLKNLPKMLLFKILVSIQFFYVPAVVTLSTGYAHRFSFLMTTYVIISGYYCSILPCAYLQFFFYYSIICNYSFLEKKPAAPKSKSPGPKTPACKKEPKKAPARATKGKAKQTKDQDGNLEYLLCFDI